MGAFIAKQPNGLYCRFSSVVDCPTHYNMTEEDYVKRVARTEKDGREVMDNYLQPFQEVIERFAPNNMSEEEFNELVEEMSNHLEEE